MTGLIIEPFAETSVRTHSYAHAGAAYLDSFRRLLDAPTPGAWVLLPLLHMSLELLVKAHATRVDPTFEGKSFSHRTHQIIKHYGASVPAFAGLAASAPDMELIEQLATAWLKVRYVEASVFVGEGVFPRAVSIADALADAHFHETGIEVFDRHFEAKRAALRAAKA